MDEGSRVRNYLSLFSLEPYANDYSTLIGLDQNVQITHVSDRVRLFLESFMPPHSCEIRGTNERYYGFVLCYAEAVSLLKMRFRLRGGSCHDSNENQDMCDARLIPFFTGGDGLIYSINSDYCETDKKHIVVLEPGTSWGPPGNQRIRDAGIIPLSVASFFESLAEHACLPMSAWKDCDEVPPDSLIVWPGKYSGI